MSGHPDVNTRRKVRIDANQYCGDQLLSTYALDGHPMFLLAGRS
jgi:hypothetical protein